MSPPLEEQASCSCGPTHSESAGQVEDGAPLGVHSGWAFEDNCRNLASRTKVWWRRRSPDLALGSKIGGFDLVLTVPRDAGTVGSGLVALQGGGVEETHVQSGESWGSELRADDPAHQLVGWSSWLPRFL